MVAPLLNTCPPPPSTAPHIAPAPLDYQHVMARQIAVGPAITGDYPVVRGRHIALKASPVTTGLLTASASV